MFRLTVPRKGRGWDVTFSISDNKRPSPGNPGVWVLGPLPIDTTHAFSCAAASVAAAIFL